MENKVRLCDAKFGLFDCDGRQIACGVTNGKGELTFECLPFGRYFVKELEAPCGYEKSCDCAEVDVDCCNEHKVVEFLNKRKLGSIKVVKYGICGRHNGRDGSCCDR